MKGKKVHGIDERKGLNESNSVAQDTTQKCDGHGENAEHDSEESMSEDKMNSIEGSQGSLEIDGSEESNISRLKGHNKDGCLGNGQINGKSESSKRVILKVKALPSPQYLRSNHLLCTLQVHLRVIILLQNHHLRCTLGAPSRNHIAAKRPSPLHRLSGTCSKIINSNQVAAKLSTSKLEMKKVDTSVTVSPSSGSSVHGDEISNIKKVRVIRVVSTIRRQRKITSVAAKDHDDQGLKEDTAEAIKITPGKESMGNSNVDITTDSMHPSTPSVTKSTVRSRISHVPSRLKNSPAEPGQITTTKVVPTSGLRKSKAVDLQSETHRPSTLKAGRVPLIGETAHTNRRSLKKRISSDGNAIEKSSSGRFLSRRPSARKRKNAQVMFNKVIEETASRLVRTSKSKVLALVGAFETVISIQRKSSAATTPNPKKRSSSRTSE